MRSSIPNSDWQAGVVMAWAFAILPTYWAHCAIAYARGFLAGLRGGVVCPDARVVLPQCRSGLTVL